MDRGVRASGFIVLNLLIFAGWYVLLLSRRRVAPDAPLMSELVAYAGLLAATQVVLFQIVLGAIGQLRLPLLLAAQAGASAALLAWGLRPGTKAGHALVAELRTARAGLRAAAVPCNLALLALAAFLAAWLIVAAYFLPPRGPDDLVYHLPPLYQYAQTGRITLLPIELRDQFAMPMGGDFLALWTLVFFHADTWVDLVQSGVAVYGTCVLYALARSFDVPVRDAFFVALLFVFTPVVMGQAGSAYTDLTLAVCHLVLALAVVRFWRTGALLPLVMAGLAGGFGLSTKYSMLVPIAAAQPIILLRLWRDANLRFALGGYALAAGAALLLPAYWLARNFIATGFPLYPYELTPTGLHGTPGFLARVAEYGGQPGFGSALANLVHEPGRFLLYQILDPGLGSLNGGFGAIFWGLGVPSLAWQGCRALRSAVSRDFFPALFWAQVPLFVAVYWLQTDIARLRYNQRLSLVVAGFGLLALAMVIPKLRAAGPGVTLGVRLLALAASALAVVQLAGYALPSFQIREAVADRARDSSTSEYRYLQHSYGELPRLAAAWDPLDFLTAGGAGWDVYFAAPWPEFLTAPLFGSVLQNRVWNFRAGNRDESAGRPDALLYHFTPDPAAKTFYLGVPITPGQASRDADYELVTGTPDTQLWVRRERLAEPATRARLAAYYRSRFGAQIDALAAVVPRLPRAGALITSSEWGPALRYFALSGALPTPVYLVPAGGERSLALRLGAAQVVSVQVALPGSVATPLFTLDTASGAVRFFLNEVRP